MGWKLIKMGLDGGKIKKKSRINKMMGRNELGECKRHAKVGMEEWREKKIDT